MTPAQQALDLWNAYAARCGWPLVRRMTPDRAKKLAKLIAHGLDDWREALAKAEASSFLRGENQRGWRLNFDTLLRESFFVKLLEGNYDNANSVPTTTDPHVLLRRARERGYRDSGFWLPSWGPRPGEVH